MQGNQVDKLPKDIHLYYQYAAEKLKINLLDVVLVDRLLQGEMMRKEVEHKHFIVNQL